MIVILAVSFFILFIGLTYKTVNYKNTENAKKGFYSYNLNGIRLLFSGERDLGKEIPGMQILHLNDFWEEEGCANMIPSLFVDTAFFVDKKITIGKEGKITRQSFIYTFDFTSSTLREFKSPISVERIYKKNNSNFVASIIQKRIVLLYEIDEENNKMKLRDFFIIPSGYRFTPRTNFLQWCNFNTRDCEEKKQYLGFEEKRKLDKLSHDENEHFFSYGGKNLIIKNDYKNLFLGY